VILSFLSEAPTRGNIYDKNNHALANLGEVVTVGLVPQFIENEPTVVATVAQLTGVPPEKIRERLVAAQPDWFVPIADVSFETSLQNDDLLASLAGVDRRARTVRTYADGDIAAHVIGYMGKIPPELKDQYVAQGYTGDEQIGLTGVESWAEADLAGTRGGRLVTLSPGRKVLAQLATAPTKAGSSVYLTSRRGTYGTEDISGCNLLKNAGIPHDPVERHQIAKEKENETGVFFSSGVRLYDPDARRMRH